MFFEDGFNKCNILVYNCIISDDIEFYHDKGGITNGKASFIASVKNNICNAKNRIRRELAKGSRKVFPLESNNELYGAVQTGVHSFFVQENQARKKVGTAKFTHLWLLQNGVWQLKGVLSYDHLH